MIYVGTVQRTLLLSEKGLGNPDMSYWDGYRSIIAIALNDAFRVFGLLRAQMHGCSIQDLYEAWYAGYRYSQPASPIPLFPSPSIV